MAGKRNSNRSRPAAKGFVVQTVKFMIGANRIRTATSDIKSAMDFKRKAGDSCVPPKRIRDINQHTPLERIHDANLPSTSARPQAFAVFLVGHSGILVFSGAEGVRRLKQCHSSTGDVK